MPGLVYLYMPALSEMLGWDSEQRLWFAFLNGLTQNPITSLKLFLRLDHVPTYRLDIRRFDEWFNTNWHSLQFDTDRKYQKKDTAAAIESYADLVREYGSQAKMLTGKPYENLWTIATSIPTFGRLSAFSYLEYVYIMGHGADCTSLMFNDKAGSKSHRNGMLLLLGQDSLVWDKRQHRSHNGEYENFQGLCEQLEQQADEIIADLRTRGIPASKFTFESNLCTFKNHFYGHRYPGVYADMAWQRIEHAEQQGSNEIADIFRHIRKAKLPKWLLMENETGEQPTIKQRARVFAETGFPYRGKYFLARQTTPR